LKIRAVFPGTFDPIHNGHIDIALRASKIFDELIVAVYDMPMKDTLFSSSERYDLVSHTFRSTRNISVMRYQGLTVEFCREQNAQVVVRGLRVFSDFEHEFRMALANHRLAPEIDVVALMTSEEHTFLTGSTVREIASLGGDISSLVPDPIAEAMRERFEELREAGVNVVRMTSLRD
jgi:pantetheine-phosphate adenylyltransferase